MPLLEELGRRGMTQPPRRRGRQVLGSFLDEGQVDAVDVFIAPIVEGGDHARTPVRGKGRERMQRRDRLRELDVTQVGGDVRIRGSRARSRGASWRASASD